MSDPQRVAEPPMLSPTVASVVINAIALIRKIEAVYLTPLPKGADRGARHPNELGPPPDG